MRLRKLYDTNPPSREELPALRILVFISGLNTDIWHQWKMDMFHHPSGRPVININYIIHPFFLVFCLSFFPLASPLFYLLPTFIFLTSFDILDSLPSSFYLSSSFTFLTSYSFFLDLFSPSFYFLLLLFSSLLPHSF